MNTSLYRHFDSNDTLLYVGVSLSVIQRLGQHSEHSAWFKAIARVTIEHFDTREQALRAERDAIIKESPKHNIHFKRGQAQAHLIANALAQARDDLTDRVVRMNPIYSLQSAADALCVKVGLVNQWVRDGKIGHLEMPNKNGRMIPYISGWQLIDFIESMMEDARDGSRPAIAAPPPAQETHGSSQSVGECPDAR